MLDLSILGACRQIYEEASVLLWTTNTFSFEDSTPLRKFIRSLHSTQIRKLTRMHIDVAWELNSIREWEVLLRRSFISKLKGLRTLHATFDQYFGNCYIDRMLSPSYKFHQLNIAMMSRMQMLPLQHVTVVVGDDIGGPYPKRDRWTITKKREVAEGLRNKLLDPNGYEILAAEMKAEEAKRKKEREEEQARKAARRALHERAHEALGEYEDGEHTSSSFRTS